MKILWLSHLVPYPPKGGVMQRSYNLMKEMSKYHDLYIICFFQKSLQPTDADRQNAIKGLSQLGRIVSTFELNSDKSRINNLWLAIKSLFTRDPYTVNWLKKGGLSESIQAAINKNTINLVHFDTISWAPYIKDAHGCKRVLNHHNIESHMMLRRAKKEKNIFKKIYFYQEGWKIQAYEKKYCNKFDLNITCSEVDVGRLKSISPNIFAHDIPNGVDIDYFYPLRLPEIPNSMVFVGGMSWYPNIAAMKFFVLEVLPRIIKKIPDAHLTIIGRNPPTWLSELGKTNHNITVTGFVDDVRPFIDKASIYICPINDGGGTKLKVLDALAMGKAIVAHPIACEGINVSDGEDVYYASTAQEFEKNIVMLFSSDTLRKKMGEKGRLLIESDYNFECIGKNMSNLYTQLL